MWVLIEHRDGEIAEASLEVLCEAKRLAGKAKLEVTAVVAGKSDQSFPAILAQYGADRVFLVEHPLLERYTTDAYTTALAQLLKEHEPEAFILAATALGSDLAPRLSTRVRTSLVSNCTVLDYNDQGTLEMTRPSCGGRVYSTMTAPFARPRIVTVRPGVLGVGKALKGREAKVETLAVELSPGQVRTKNLGESRVEREKLDIIEADVVLAFGRGLSDGEMLPKMEELARLMNASVAGSRAAVDERWIPFMRQIGQTGKTIAPKFILCCGISGAQQFSMGMRESRLIVAINTDKNAPIFKVADVSVLGSLHEVVPELVERLNALNLSSAA